MEELLNELNLSIVNDILYSKEIFRVDTKKNVRVWQIAAQVYALDTTTNTYQTVVHFTRYDVEQWARSFSEFPKNYAVGIWAIFGIHDGQKTSQDKNIISKNKNVGKSNEHSPFQNALVTMRSELRKKIQHGYSEQLSTQDTPSDEQIYYPMLAQTLTKNEHKVYFPVYLQPKLDGVRMFVGLVAGKLRMISRNNKPWNELLPELEKELTLLYKHIPEDTWLDGELYSHGKPLQDIVSAVRNKTSAEKTEIQFYVFDAYFSKSPGMPFSERISKLQHMIPATGNILLVETTVADNQTGIDQKTVEYLDKKYEGAIIRLDAPYETSTTGSIRSFNIYKYKPKFTEEFEIADILAGTKGIAKGAVVFQLKLPTGELFNAQPKNMSYEQQKEMYTSLSAKKSEVVGKLATIEFEDKSKNGIPLRPKFIAIRNYE